MTNEKKEITKSRIGDGGTYFSLPAGQSLMQEEEDVFLSVPELLETFEFCRTLSVIRLRDKSQRR